MPTSRTVPELSRYDLGPATSGIELRMKTKEANKTRMKMAIRFSPKILGLYLEKKANSEKINRIKIAVWEKLKN